MKKKFCLLLSFILILSLTACAPKVPSFNGNNDNYESTELDQDGNPIYSTSPSTAPTETEDTETTEPLTEEYEFPDPPEICNIENKLKIHFIDCKEGNSTFIELPNQKSLIINGGTDSEGSDICKYIRSLGYTKIDMVIGTSPANKNIGGLDKILQSFEIGKIFMPQVPEKIVPNTDDYHDLLMTISNKGLKINKAQNQKFYDDSSNDCFLHFLNTPQDMNSNNIEDFSIVCKLHYRNVNCIFVGDITRNIEENILANFPSELLNCDIYRLNYSGKATESTNKWLNTLNPEHVYVFRTKQNIPDDEVISTLNKNNSKIYFSDIDGTCKVETSGSLIYVSKQMTKNKIMGD